MRVVRPLLLAAGVLVAGLAPAATPGAPQQPSSAAGTQALPRMQIVQQYAGPFPDTLIQKLYDPQSGVLCYLYIPVKVANAQDQGIAVYGANTIGSISCLQSAPPR